MFVIAVPDLQQSADFYGNVLGFEIQEIGDDGWRLYLKDNCHIMAGNCPDAITPNKLGDHSYFCYLVVDNADDYYAELIANNAELTTKPEDKPWQMREFPITTVDGHRIMVGERL